MLSLEDQAGPSVQQGSWQLPRAAPVDAVSVQTWGPPNVGSMAAE